MKLGYAEQVPWGSGQLVFGCDHFPGQVETLEAQQFWAAMSDKEGLFA